MKNTILFMILRILDPIGLPGLVFSVRAVSIDRPGGLREVLRIKVHGFWWFLWFSNGLGGSGGIPKTIRMHTNRSWADLVLQDIGK